jgi:hypothetical protein
MLIGQLPEKVIGNPLVNLLVDVIGYWPPYKKFLRGNWQLLKTKNR